MTRLTEPMPHPADPAAAAALPWVDFSRFSYRPLAGCPTPPPGHFANPVLRGFHPDPSICRSGDDFWLVTSSFGFFPGLPIHHSRNLADWRLVGHAIERPGQLDYGGIGVSRGLFAPALSLHRGVFHLVCTMVDGGGNFLITADHPAGPWSDPQWLPVEGIDPSLFFDDDGRAWLLNNGPPEGRPRYDGHRAIWLQRWDVDRRRPVGPRRVVVDGGADPAKQPIWIEGPHLLKRQGWYILCAAEGGTWTQHAQVVFRSRRVEGPYEPWSGNPILTQRDLDAGATGAVTCAGHAQLFVGPDGQWWSVFLGCRPGPDGSWMTGRETFVAPVHWTDDGWPLILPQGQRVPLQLPRPAAAGTACAPAHDGGFEGQVDGHMGSHFDDHFNTPTLDPGWLTLRPGAQPGWRLHNGRLQLQARGDALGGQGHPSALWRRVADAAFEARLTLAAPQQGQVVSGLALLQSEAQHLLLAAERQTDGGLVLRLECCRDARVVELARHPVPHDTGRLELILRCDGQRLHAEACVAGAAPEPLLCLADGLDARMLSVQAAGGGRHFTGAVVGPMARLAAAA